MESFEIVVCGFFFHFSETGKHGAETSNEWLSRHSDHLW
jgi:hypothetical protein